MGKETGFLEYKRVDNSIVPPAERILTFKEFHTPMISDERRKQAARCMNCGVPFCQSAMELSGMVTGCPLHNLIPEWNHEIYEGHDEHAFHRLRKTSNFPEFTGRVCPALCEKACMCGQHGDAVTVHENELFLIENAFENGYVTPMIPKMRSSKKIAVIGSGPSGLAAADELNHRGHNVEVFERDDHIGGLLMYGIPNMKLDKKVIERRQKLMEAEGVIFHTGINVGIDKKTEELLSEFDAVILCCGSKKPRPLACADPETTKGVYYAVDYLAQTTKELLKTGDLSSESLKKQKGLISAEGKNVVIVGGGDTGNDCIGTVIRENAKSVTAIEMMPKPPVERRADNPWPEWPKVLKTDYGHEEAIHVFGSDPRVFETTVKSVSTDKSGKIKQVETVQVTFKNGKLTEVAGTEKKIKCDLLLIAAGFIGFEDYIAESFHVEKAPRGNAVTDAGSYRIGKGKLFTAGDMHRGQSLVVWAIAEGRACAKEVDRYLMTF